ncbi:MAG: amidase, partial [Gammaproteobacteria bacterium]|nr:amidase [Gammaproteobacteria bacterium]
MQRGGLLSICLVLAACSQPTENYAEATITELQDRMQRGELTSEHLVNWYLQRIEEIDRAGPQLNSIIELNPDALTIARALDEEWQ